MPAIYMDDYRNTDHLSAVFGTGRQLGDYVSRNFNSFIEAVGNVADKSLKAVTDIYNDLNSTVRKVGIELLQARLAGGWHVDTVRQLRTLDELQTATPVMQNYLMALPPLQELWSNGAISGWGQPADHFDQRKGHDNPYYRAVMNGIAYQDDDGKLQTTEYLEANHKDISLTLPEKVLVIASWNVVKDNIRLATYDPTSVLNEYIG